MVKVEMPRGSWEIVLMLIEDHIINGSGGYLSKQLLKEIENQVYSQEY